MSEPRFYVGSVTGYVYFGGKPPFYVADYSGSVHRKPLTTWYVYDRAFCCKPVRQFDHIAPRKRLSWWPVIQKGPTAEEKARAYAAELNARNA